MFTEMLAVHCKNRTKSTNVVCGQNAGTSSVKASGTLSNRQHCVFKV